MHNTKIIETDGEEILSANEELKNDLITIITLFSSKLYGLRSQKMKDKGYIGGCKGMTHLWKSIGDKRTIVFEYKPSDTILKYLNDMRDLINRAIISAYSMAKSNNNELPSPIVLRKSLKNYYDNNIIYAKHHINPACRNAIQNYG
ncbi:MULTISPECIES: hypothetical protein [Acidiplasma]|uniref:hypothetical protein n=1 Tax=Acidiplasma TaxID=507753 RepID=UPI000698B2A9|nr:MULTISPECIES: hypothetical protein [Acidiplasma]WMT54403.1 MAG: hypothetical protein RE470_05665 [Acidiplasma sp.]